MGSKKEWSQGVATTLLCGICQGLFCVSFHRRAGRALAIAVGVGGTTLLTHSLELCLPLLLHSALDSASLHIGVGRNLRLYGVSFEYLGHREREDKEAHYDDADDDY